MRFTDIAIRNLKPDEKKYYRREADGFAIRVMPSGVKTWLFICTYDGKRKEMNLGQYPHVTLSDARTKFKNAFELLKNGKDPAAVEQQEKEEQRNAPTVSDLAKDYIEKWVKKKKVDRSIYDDTRTLEKDVLPKWGNRKAAEIRRRDAILLLEEVAERAPGQARNVLKVARKMFSFALQREIVEINPFSMITNSIPELAPCKRDRVLSADEVRQLWVKLETASGSAEAKRCIKLILATGQRPGEVAGIHREEIVDRWWTIPAGRVKTRSEHRIYLNDLALEIIGDTGGYIFPSPDGEKPFTVNALSRVLRRNFAFPLTDENGRPIIGEDGKQKTENRLGLSHFTPHDLRRTVRTFLAEIGVSRDHAEAVMNHKLQGIEAVYNKHKYYAEIQLALKSWERKLKMIISGKTPGKVKSIDKAKRKRVAPRQKRA